MHKARIEWDFCINFGKISLSKEKLLEILGEIISLGGFSV